MPENLGPVVNSSEHDAAPRISKDSLELYFSSGRPGIFGRSDIFVSRRETTNDPWCVPVNLGQMFNSPPNQQTNQQSPTLSADGLTLYFLSTGPWGSKRARYQAPIIPIVDFDDDGEVAINDLLIMIEHWGTDEPLCDIGPMPWGDGVVDAPLVRQRWDNSAVVVYPDHPAPTTIDTWQQWSIDLTEFIGVDPTAIKKMSIGVGDQASTEPGGSGILYIDNIGLHLPPAP